MVRIFEHECSIVRTSWVNHTPTLPQEYVMMQTSSQYPQGYVLDHQEDGRSVTMHIVQVKR